MLGWPPVQLLTLDRGNSTLDAMLHGPSGRRQRLDPADPTALAAFLAGEAPAAAVGVSVVPDGLAQAATELAARGIQLRLVGRDLQCPLPLDYQTPATLGADRWLGALAAHRAFGAAITVDCGSATTVNLITQDGVFRGGAIAPGLRAMQAGMAARTPHLPPVDAAMAGEVPARSSQAAVSHGVLVGWCGAIERLVADLFAVVDPPCTVVLTGGDAQSYQAHGRLACEWVPDLVHRGLALLPHEPCCR